MQGKEALLKHGHSSTSVPTSALPPVSQEEPIVPRFQSTHDSRRTADQATPSPPLSRRAPCHVRSLPCVIMSRQSLSCDGRWFCVNIGVRQMVSEKNGVCIVDAVSRPHMCQNSLPNSCPRTFNSRPQVWCMFCPVRARGAHESCDDLQKPHVSHIGSLARPGTVLSSLSQCSVSALLSHGRRHRCLSRGGIGGPRLVMTSSFVSSFCVHVVSCCRCGCVFRFVWRARPCNSARCSSADLRRRPRTDEMLSNPKTTTCERRSF